MPIPCAGEVRFTRAGLSDRIAAGWRCSKRQRELPIICALVFAISDAEKRQSQFVRCLDAYVLGWRGYTDTDPRRGGKDGLCHRMGCDAFHVAMVEHKEN